MVRVMAGLAAWATGTAIAVCVAWFGANIVVRDAGVNPGMPAINVAVAPSPAAPSPPVVSPAALSPASVSSAPVPSAPVPSAPVTPSAPGSAGSAAPSPARSTPAGPSASASPDDDVRGYALTGGRVTLDVAHGSVQLVTAVPEAGYSVQTWSGTGWLRVDFSSGAKVSSLIASWYQHAPAITVTN